MSRTCRLFFAKARQGEAVPAGISLGWPVPGPQSTGAADRLGCH